MRDGLEPEGSRLVGIHHHDASLLKVRRRAQVELLRLIEQRGHEIGTFRAELEAVGAVRLDPPHPGARLLGRRHRALSPPRARALIHHVPRRRDLVPGAPLLLVNGIREAGERYAAHSRYAVREPELVVVLGFRRFLRRALMYVEIDDAGHDVHALGVDLSRSRLGPARRVDGHVRNTDRSDIRDAISLDDDVDGAAGRTAGPVDQRRAANDQALEGSIALVAIRRELRVFALLVAQTPRAGGVRPGRPLLRAGGESNESDEEGSDQASASHDDIHGGSGLSSRGAQRRGICSLVLAEAYLKSRARCARSYFPRQQERERARAAHATPYSTGSVVSASEQQIPRYARDDNGIPEDGKP